MKKRFNCGARKPDRRLKKAYEEGRVIVFIDESGIFERPTRIRTWAAVGETPVLQFHLNWKHVLIIAGLSRVSCYFRMHDGSVNSPQIVEFLKALMKQIIRPIQVVWDGLRPHRSRLVRDCLDSTNGRTKVAFLPPYALDTNPVEFFWAWLKRHALANFCPELLDELKVTARSKMKSGQRRKSIIVACWKQAELW